jgi:hypothetical protein
MTPTERAALRWGLAAAVDREIEHREKMRATEGSGVREAFIARLIEIGERLRSHPGYVPLTPAQQRQDAVYIGRWFRKHGYGRGSSNP